MEEELWSVGSFFRVMGSPFSMPGIVLLGCLPGQ